jgi:hypothetical protein
MRLSAEYALRPGADAGTQAENEPATGNTVHVNSGHGGLKGAAGGCDGNPAGNLQLLGGGMKGGPYTWGANTPTTPWLSACCAICAMIGAGSGCTTPQCRSSFEELGI